MYELSKQFIFEAANTFSGSSLHGHLYRADITLRGEPSPDTGMIMDLSRFEQAMQAARKELDHQMLDDVGDLGPATLENLSNWIWRKLSPHLPHLARVTVTRDGSGENCVYYGPPQ